VDSISVLWELQGDRPGQSNWNSVPPVYMLIIVPCTFYLLSSILFRQIRFYAECLFNWALSSCLSVWSKLTTAQRISTKIYISEFQCSLSTLSNFV
jgi:hypothetical protein